MILNVIKKKNENLKFIYCKKEKNSTNYEISIMTNYDNQSWHSFIIDS